MKVWKKIFRGISLWLILAFAFLTAGCTKTGEFTEEAYGSYAEENASYADTAADTDNDDYTANEAFSISNEIGDAGADSAEADLGQKSLGIDENGTYTSKDDVADYINTFGKLPANFITKKEAQKLGWPGGSLEEYAPGMCIGGDYFGNYEGLLPTKKGRKYYECDIDTLGKSKRGAKRIIYSNDGLIYYTEDHYESFELLYGEP